MAQAKALRRRAARCALMQARGFPQSAGLSNAPSARMAAPTAASSDAARNIGTPSDLARMAVHAALRAPPPTLRTERSRGAPSSARRR